MILPGLDFFYNRYRTLVSSLITCGTKIVDFIGLQSVPVAGKSLLTWLNKSEFGDFRSPEYTPGAVGNAPFSRFLSLF